MIGKIQSYSPFKGVYIKKNGTTQKNIKKAYRDLEQNIASSGIISMTDFQRTSFNATLDYGLKSLNDQKIDDGKKRFLTLDPLYSQESGLLSGYELGIVEKDGSLVAHGGSYLEGAGVYTLKTAFDNLKENYKEALSKLAVEKYSKPVSLNTVISSYLSDNGPDEA